MWHLLSSPWILLRASPLFALAFSLKTRSGGFAVAIGYVLSLAACLLWLDPALAGLGGVPVVGTSAGKQALLATSAFSIPVAAPPGTLRDARANPEVFVWRASVVSVFMGLLAFGPHVTRGIAIFFVLAGRL